MNLSTALQRLSRLGHIGALCAALMLVNVAHLGAVSSAVAGAPPAWMQALGLSWADICGAGGSGGGQDDGPTKQVHCSLCEVLSGSILNTQDNVTTIVPRPTQPQRPASLGVQTGQARHTRPLIRAPPVGVHHHI